MSISFSGLASGLDTSSWVTSLTALKNAKVTTLEAQKTEVTTCQDALTNIKSFFSSFRSTIEKITDSKFNIASMDLFSQKLATSANLGVLTATASTDAQEGIYNVKVDRLASNTEATSSYRYKTTIVETTTAISDSKLTDLSYIDEDTGDTKFIKTGTIGVTVNGVERGIKITSTDTLGTFVNKLKDIGVSAYYNEDTGVFTINSSVEYIRDIENTGIVKALHLKGVNEGYKTNNNLKIEEEETIYSVATKGTNLGELGVTSGKLEIQANGVNYTGDDALTISSTDTIQDLINKFAAIHVDADLVDGVFTIDDAEILSGTTTNLAEVFGFENSVIAQNTQASSALSHSITTTDTEVATLATELQDLGEGLTIADDSTFVVKNSDNTLHTITVSGTTTIGQVVEDLQAAGLSAQFSNRGELIISGGVVYDNDGTAGQFDIVSIFGLSSQADTAMAIGESLTEKIEYIDIATLDTKLVDDFGIINGSRLRVVNGSNETTTITVTDTMDVEDFMNELYTRGIASEFDEDTGVLTITGGQYTELYGTSYTFGNILYKLFGSSTIPDTNTQVASTNAISAQLRYTVTNTIQATTATTLGTLGLADGQSIATFDVRGETRTVTVDSSMTISSFLSAMTSAGISATFDENTSRVTVDNATLTSSTGVGTLGGVLGISETTTGRFVSSSKMYKVNTTNVSSTGATLSTVLNVTAGYETKFEELNMTSNLTATIHNSGGTAVKTITMNSTDSLRDFFEDLDDEGITASISNGVITMSSSTNKYITGGLATQIGMSTTSHDYVAQTEQKSTSAVQFTDSYNATRENTLAQVSVLTSGTSVLTVRNRYNMEVGKVTVSSSTTIGSMLDSLGSLDCSATIANGQISFNMSNGYTISGAVYDAVKGGRTLTYADTRNVESSTELSKFGVTSGNIKIHKDDGTYKTINVNSSSNLGSFLATLQANNFVVNIDQGTITVTGTGDTYLESVSGGSNIMTQLKLGTLSKTDATIYTNTHSNNLGYTTTVSATKDTALQDLQTATGATAITFTGNNVTMNVTAYSANGSSSSVSLSFSKTATLNDVFNRLSNLGINAVIDSTGQISLSSSTLIDFDLTGTLGQYLCGGSCTRSHGTVVNAATSSVKLSDLTNSSGTNLGITSGNIDVYQNGTRNVISIDNSTTLETLASRLSQYGISMNVATDGTIYFTGSGDSYLATSSSGASNMLTQLGVSGTWTATTNSQSKVLEYTETPNNVITGNTKIVELNDNAGNSLGITTGTFDVYSNGVKSTKTITSDTTVDDFVAMLTGAGMNVNISSDGKINVGASNNSYIATSATGTPSNVVSQVFSDGWNFTKVYTSKPMTMERVENEAITRNTKLSEITYNTFMSEITAVTPQTIVTSASDLATALATYDTVGVANADVLHELAVIVNSGTNNCSGKTIVLTQDIDLNDCADNTDADGWTAIGTSDYSHAFAGTFDGQGHTILNLYIDKSTVNKQGLFGQVDTSTGIIKNVGLRNCNITGDNCVGGLVGDGGAQIVNCYITGTVTGNQYVGGLSGVGGAVVDSCCATVNVLGNDSVGGLVGSGSNSIINCCSTGNVSGNTMIGGLGGQCRDIQNCYATGNVTGNENVGGLTGASRNNTNCFSYGNVVGVTNVGGLNGYSWGNITDSTSYATLVSGDTNIGSLVGLINNSYTITGANCVEISGIQKVGNTTSFDSNISYVSPSDAPSTSAFTPGYISVVRNGVVSNIELTADETVGTLMDRLALYGFDSSISVNGQLVIRNTGDSYLKEYTGSGTASNALDILGVDYSDGDWITTNSYSSKDMDTIEYDTVQTTATRETQLSDLGVTTGEFYVYKNGVKFTAMISSDTTVGQFLDTLTSFGLTASLIQNGDDTSTIKVLGQNNSYVAKSASTDTNIASNVVQQLGLDAVDAVYDYESNYMQTSALVTNTLAATESTLLSYFDKIAGINQTGTKSLKCEYRYNFEYCPLASITLPSTIALPLPEDTGGSTPIPISTDSAAYSTYLENTTIAEIYGCSESDEFKITMNEKGSYHGSLWETKEYTLKGSDSIDDLGIIIYGNYQPIVSSNAIVGIKHDSYADGGVVKRILKDETNLPFALTSTSILKGTITANATATSTLRECGMPERATLGGTTIDGGTIYYADGSTFEYDGSTQIGEIGSVDSSGHFVTGTDKAIVAIDGVLPTFLGIKVGDGKSYDSGTINKSEGILSVTVDGLTNNVSISATETIGSLLDKFRAMGLEATLSEDGEILIESGFKEMTINTTGTTSHLLDNLGLKFNSDFGGYAASSVAVQSTITTIEDKTVSCAKHADYDTKMSLVNLSSGTLSLYRNGQKATLNINSDETFGTLRSRVNSAFDDVDLVFEDGYLKFISSTEGVVIDIGATTDTSNFVAICGMSGTGENVVQSSRELYKVNGESVLMTEDLFNYGNVTAGTFTIGDAEFEITEFTTLNNIISQINSSDAANATAYWDSVDGKLVVKSRITGSSLINIEAGTTNFTHVMGLTASETIQDGDGNDVEISKLVKDTQVIGENARFSINGTYYTSTSNTVSSDISRIQGVTLNLKDVSDSSVTLTIEKDKETVSNAVSEIVDAYNELIENVDTELATTGNLKDQTTLKMIRNQLRNLMTSSIVGTAVYKNLMSIGIKTGSASAGNISTSSVNTINFDADKFLDAFTADSDALKTLLIGNDTTKGIFIQMEDIVENALDGATGYFTTANNAYNKKITTLNTQIEKATAAVDKYKSRLESRFSSMDLLIANLQNQYSAFLSA